MPHVHDEHCHSHAERLAEAEVLCQRRDARFTSMRRATYDFLLTQKSPLSAYDILARLETALQKKLAPPTVYRALEFLLDQGLLHRLEVNNTYLVCDHPTEAHESLYLVCTACGVAQEVDDHSIGALLKQKAHAHGFKPAKQVMEIQGLCKRCA